MLLFHTLMHPFPQSSPCLHNLCNHVPDLDQVIMVFDPLVVFTEQVLQIISLILLRIKPFIFYFPAHPPLLHQIAYVLFSHRQTCQKTERLFSSRSILHIPLFMVRFSSSPYSIKLILHLFTARGPLIATIRGDIPNFAAQKSPLTPESYSHGMRS